MIAFSACHLISSPETLFGESGISNLNDRADLQEEKSCLYITDRNAKDLSPFSSWWEGRWKIDQQKLAIKLAEEMGSSRDDLNIKAISASLASAFSVKIHAQQATLSIDGQQQRLATTPLQQNRGVRLIGGQRELTLWCEGQTVFWKAESGETFPVHLIK